MSRHNLPAISVAILSLSVLICVLLVWTWSRYAPPAPVAVFRCPVVDAGKAAFCPGDVLTYRQQMTIVNAPATLRFIRALWSFDKDATVGFDESPDWANYTQPITVRQEFSYIIPRVPPGAYELRVSVTGDSTWRTSMYTVAPITVRAECP